MFALYLLRSAEWTRATNLRDRSTWTLPALMYAAVMLPRLLEPAVRDFACALKQRGYPAESQPDAVGLFFSSRRPEIKAPLSWPNAAIAPSRFHVRHKQPIGHALLEISDHPCSLAGIEMASASPSAV